MFLKVWNKVCAHLARTRVPKPLPQLVVCAAIRNADSDIVCGARHYDDIMRAQLAQRPGGRKAWLDGQREVQGFIDQRGKFLTREEAWEVAKAAKQIRRVTGVEGTLYSEDLY